MLSEVLWIERVEAYPTGGCSGRHRGCSGIDSTDKQGGTSGGGMVFFVYLYSVVCSRTVD